MTLKLGRKPARQDARTLRLSRYLAPAAFKDVPPMTNWGTAVPAWGMMLNDQLGDCTAAAAAHIIACQTANQGAPVTIADDDVVALYSQTSGYQAGQPGTDRGAVEIDVLNYWRKTGVSGHQIAAYAALDAKDPDMLRAAIWLFGAIYVGVDLPVSAQDQTIWAVTDDALAGYAAPGSWGGHAVPIVGYDTRAFACVTWGAMQWMTEAWWLAYGDEAYAVVSPDWVPPSGAAPNHFNMAELMADLATVTKPEGAHP